MSASQHIDWLNLVEKTGPFLAVGVLEEAFPQGLQKVETPKRQRVRSAYDEWRDAVDGEDAQLAALHREWIRLILLELLEFEPSVLKPTDQLPPTLVYREPLAGAEVKPEFAVLSGDKARLLISSFGPDVDLSAPLAGESWTASPIERMTMLCRATGVRVGLVTNGERWTIVSVPADGSSSLGTWFARIWQQEPVTLQAFVSLLEVRRCFGPEDGTLDALFLRSLEHQNEVTDTLGEQVRRAVEVLVQALDRADLDRDRQLLKDVTPAQLYEAGLTVMMRLVVLLCAEERKLLLLGEPIYDQNYAISTLRSKLREEKERLGDEVLERRHDAWARLLAVFRAVFGGIEHETLRLPPLGGSLFDPDRFPFLEGRAKETSWRTTPAMPLPIDNRTVLMLLTALQVLEQRTGAMLLSYEALDVEQIGHVYEGLLERTVKRVPETTLGLIGSQKAINPNVPLRELEEAKAKGDDKLLEFLLEKTGRSEAGLKRTLTKPVDEATYHRVLLACGSDTPLADRMKPWALLLRTDSWGDPLVYRENSFVVTMGAGRRETGTHYTPKTLTEPIVQHTLEPLVYVGPAEGKPQAEWRLKSPSELLALKVCDMTMGSGAFLVQTCRWLADRLVEAWDAAEKSGHQVAIEGEVLPPSKSPSPTGVGEGGRRPDEGCQEENQSSEASPDSALRTPRSAIGPELLPRDKAERVLIARRLITSRCLYGVDINPMAVELAKVSLWLVTMMKGRPFSFLDHALKCGDSLLGVSTLPQIENFSLRPGERQVTFATANLFRYVEQAGQKRRELEDLPSNDHTQIETKNRLHAEAEAATAKVKALADCLIALELRGLDGVKYDEARAIAADHAQSLIRKIADQEQAKSRPLTKTELDAITSSFFIHNSSLPLRRPFHWPVEFPEVFARGGFDAFVGNPPFVGGKKITGLAGTDYRDFIVAHLAKGKLGVADLCAFFFLRVHSLVRAEGGVFGLIATNTIAQGDTREVGLEQLLAQATTVIRAVQSAPWPGDAALEVAHVWITRGRWQGDYVLDGKLVAGITPLLNPSSELSLQPIRLAENARKSFQGSVLLGTGFLLTEEEARSLIAKDQRNRDVLFPFINGDDLNSRPDQSPSRRVINFFDWPLERTANGRWDQSAERERDKWQRDGRVPKDYPNPVAADYPDCLNIVIERVKPERDAVNREVYRSRWWNYAERQKSLYEGLQHVSRAIVTAQTSKYTTVSIQPTSLVFSQAVIVILLEKSLHLAVLISSLHTTWVSQFASSLETRLRYVPTDCLENFPFPRLAGNDDSVGSTGEIYHDVRRDIMISRQEGLTKTYNRFHDRGEASADIARLRALHAELDQAVAAAYGWSELDLGHGFHETKQGVRYTLSEPARRTVLDRLLQLNHQRYAEEVKAGLHERGAKKGKTKKAQSTATSPQPDLIKPPQQEFSL